LPYLYTVTQHMPQWTPQLNRLMQFAPENKAEAFDWSAVADAKFKPFNADTGLVSVRGAEAINSVQKHQTAILDGNWQQEIAKQVVLAFGPDAAAYVFRGGEWQNVTGSTPLAQLGTNNNQYYNGSYWVHEAKGRTFLLDACVSPTVGLFSVVSQISPNGGRDFEDLTLLDPTDENQWLLVIVVPNGDDLLVYRKLYVK